MSDTNQVDYHDDGDILLVRAVHLGLSLAPTAFLGSTCAFPLWIVDTDLSQPISPIWPLGIFAEIPVII